MPDINPTLMLRELVYYDNKPFYVVGHKIVPAALTDNKVVYQISQDLPNSFGIKRGIFPNITSVFDREELYTQAEYDINQIIQLESSANVYDKTLTGLPVITLNGETEYHYVVNDGNTYPWDQVSYPPYDPLDLIPPNTIWDDSGASIKDQEDGGHGDELIVAQHLGNIVWDNVGLTYSVDNPEFTLQVTIYYTDENDVTTIVPNINLSNIGHYEIVYEIMDNQRIYSYPVSRIIEVHETPVPPTPIC